MKKLVLFIVMFLFVGNVYAKDITLDDVVNVINDGVITDEFKESKLSELDDKTKEKLWIRPFFTKKNNLKMATR